jgi:hypothetical protein
MADTLVLKRVELLLEKTAPGNPAAKAMLLKIAMKIAAQAKLNIRKEKAIRSGELWNSIRWEYYVNGTTQGVRVGSFGVIYAAMNEFGGPISQRQAHAAFAAMKASSIKKPANVPPVLSRRGGQWYWRARPYLRPAFSQSEDYITGLIKEFYKP